jgi:hypothetical protein
VNRLELYPFTANGFLENRSTSTASLSFWRSFIHISVMGNKCYRAKRSRLPKEVWPVCYSFSFKTPFGGTSLLSHFVINSTTVPSDYSLLPSSYCSVGVGGSQP